MRSNGLLVAFLIATLILMESSISEAYNQSRGTHLDSKYEKMSSSLEKLDYVVGVSQSRYRLVLEKDCQLKSYDTCGETPKNLWSSGNPQPVDTPCQFDMNPDGIMIVYNTIDNSTIWSAGPSQPTTRGHYVAGLDKYGEFYEAHWTSGPQLSTVWASKTGCSSTGNCDCSE